MFKDSIVEEARKAGYLLAAEADFDQKKFIDNLRKKQYSAGRKPVPPPSPRSRRALPRSPARADALLHSKQQASHPNFSA